LVAWSQSSRMRERPAGLISLTARLDVIRLPRSCASDREDRGARRAIPAWPGH